MVIDKWTNISNDNNLTTPLIGHQPKETFSELKKQYNHLQSINNEYKKHLKSPPHHLSNHITGKILLRSLTIQI